jgi:phosphomannomutase
MIKFGTSGWREIIAKEFTYSNVAVVTQAIANLINEEYKKASIVVGYDTRFMSEDFARTAAEVLAGNGIGALFCKRDTPTTVIAYDIIILDLQAALILQQVAILTSNNGLKYSLAQGGCSS